MKKKLFSLLSVLFISVLSYSQGFKIEEFKQNINDGSAFHAPMDADGHPCGLVKVRTDDDKLQFGGNIIGKVENKMNEYWVFLSPGSNSLVVKHPNFMPFSIDFAKYGIEILPKATYILTLEPRKYKEKSCLVITTMPSDARLYVNDVLVENLSGNGLYKLYLEKGDYICRLEKKGYSKVVQAITIGKAPQNINAELESLMAELEVKCKTGTAEIYIDGELKGNGLWKGAVFPGEHKIEARQKNFESNSQIISIAEKENRTIVVPELKRSMGKITITTVPSNLPVIIDGKYIGISPCAVEVGSGKHYVLCSTFGCLPFRKDVEVDGVKTEVVQIEMEYTSSLFTKEEYKNAYTGNIDAIVNIIENVSEKSASTPSMKKYGEETVFWLERLSNRSVYFDKIESQERQENQNDPDVAKNMQRYLETVKLGKYFTLIKAYCNAENADGAAEILEEFLSYQRAKDYGVAYLMIRVGESYIKKRAYDDGIIYFNKALDFGTYGCYPAYEGLGDCYKAKGELQKAISFYKKFLDTDYYEGKDRVEKKLKELQ